MVGLRAEKLIAESLLREIVGPTIEEVIPQIPGWGGASQVDITPLGGGITNLNYRVQVDGEAFAVRIAGPQTGLLGIDRRREYECTLAAATIGVGPEVIHFDEGAGVLVTRFIEGRPLTVAEVGQPATLYRVVESLKRVHAGPAFPWTFSPFRTVERYRQVAEARGASLPVDLPSLLDGAAGMEAAFGRLLRAPRPCHNDLWVPNLIDDGRRVRILDWELAGMGDICFDLGNFAGSHDFSEEQDRLLLQAYFGYVTEGDLARLKLMKLMGDLRDALWAVVQSTASPIVFDFRGYAAERFTRYRAGVEGSDFQDWLRTAAG
jgi:thiamine kinase-like enzyme